MYRLVVFWLLLIPATFFGQVQFVKINASYVITTKPVVGFAFESQVDSTQCSWAASAELGRYSYEEKDLFNHSIESYSLRGMGATGEVRRYVSGKGPFGFFASGFVRLRYLRESSQSGVSVSNGGYQIDNPSLTMREGGAMNYGLALGAKTGCGDRGLHFEALAGYGWGHSALNSSKHSHKSGDFLRAELLVGVSF